MIKAIILDDEQRAIAILEWLLTESGLVDVRGKFTKALAALDFLKNNPVDIAFLDIEMPGMNGIELASQIVDLKIPVAIIFVTGYNQYAVEAFRLNALDYLVKPVAEDRLKEALNRIAREEENPLQPGPVRIQCFGKFKVSIGSCEIKFRTEKAQELLAFLTDRRGEFVHRDEICDSLWEEYEGDRVLVHFNSTLYNVKKALMRQGAAAPIEHDQGSYRLNTGGLECDYCRFQAFAVKSGGVDRGNITEYEEIARLYCGDYLAAKQFSWSVRPRQILKDQFIRLLLGMAEYYKNTGNHSKVMEWLNKGLAYEPLHRELNYKLIENLILTNDLISANRYYEIYRDELIKRLGRQPDERFQKLLG